MAEQVHVVPHHENWAVRVANRERVESTHTTKDAAVAAGRTLAESLQAELELHKPERNHLRVRLARQRSAQHSRLSAVAARSSQRGRCGGSFDGRVRLTPWDMAVAR